MIELTIQHNMAPDIEKIALGFAKGISGPVIRNSLGAAMRVVQREAKVLIKSSAKGTGLTEGGKERKDKAGPLWKHVIVVTRKSNVALRAGGYAAVGYEKGKSFHAHFVELGTAPHTTPKGFYGSDIRAASVASAIQKKGGPNLFVPIWKRFNIQGRRQLDHPGVKGRPFLRIAFSNKHLQARKAFDERIKGEIEKGLKRLVLKGLRKQFSGYKFPARQAHFTSFSNL